MKRAAIFALCLVAMTSCRSDPRSQPSLPEQDGFFVLGKRDLILKVISEDYISINGSPSDGNCIDTGKISSAWWKIERLFSKSEPRFSKEWRLDPDENLSGTIVAYGRDLGTMKELRYLGEEGALPSVVDALSAIESACGLDMDHGLFIEVARPECPVQSVPFRVSRQQSGRSLDVLISKRLIQRLKRPASADFLY